MKLKLTELQSCVEVLLRHVAERGVTELGDAQYDPYWTVLSEDWLDPNKEPQLAMGSLVDDFDELQKLLEEPTRASVVDLDRIAAMFTLLSRMLQDAPGWIVKTPDT